MLAVNTALFAYSFTMLTIILLYSRKFKYKLLSDRLYNALVVSSMFYLVGDIFSRIRGTLHPIYPVFAHIGAFSTYLIGPMIGLLWFLYIHFTLFSDVQKIKKYCKYGFILIAINTLFTIGNLFWGYYYVIDAQNVYHREVFYHIPYYGNFVLILIPIIMIIIKHDRIDHGGLGAHLSFGIIPAIGLVIQAIIPGLATIASGIALSLVILYIFVQHHRVSSDHLTGIFNRRQLDFYLEDKIKAAKKGSAFTGILLDLDDLKRINDQFGHTTGDEAIIKTAKLLNCCSGKIDFLARYGGDEFFIISNDYEKHKILDKIKTIQEKFRAFNLKHEPYQLNISIGYAVYKPDMNLSLTQFIELVDKNMYENKCETKNRG